MKIMTILFLDFDGVLHPNEVYRSREEGIVLRTGSEHQLFEHAELLSTLLEPFPEVNVVLSTSWCSALKRYDLVKSRLPKSLQARVNGATWHSAKEQYGWVGQSRYDQIMEYVNRHQISRWLAIDDDDKGWADERRNALVHTDEWQGLGKLDTQRELQEKLMRMREAPEVVKDKSRVVYQLPGMCW